MKNKPLVVDLSLDFDFFIRESPVWEMAQGESHHDRDRQILFKIALWQSRYIGVYDGTDYATATNPKTHADFLPLHLLARLKAKGLTIDAEAPRRIGFADSHRFAFEFFSRGSRAPDVLLNLDAHHDFWPTQGRPLDCGNWGTHLYDKWNRAALNTRWLQLYPRFRQPDDLPAPERPIEVQWWKDWPGFEQPAVLRHVFLCRSPEWVAPLYDEYFKDLMYGLAGLGSHYFLEQMPQRPKTTVAQVKAAFEIYQSSQLALRQHENLSQTETTTV